MIRAIVKDPLILSKKSVPAIKEDIPIGQDLLDTLKSHSAYCAGMAANMIGVHKRIIAINTAVTYLVMFNPVFEKRGKETYITTERCLSLEGERPAVRYMSITVSYMDMNWKKQRLNLKGLAAQIVQHEMDHCNGIII